MTPQRSSTATGSGRTGTTFASLKHTHEKVGDHWEAKDHKGPSDAPAEKTGEAARRGGRPPAG